MRTGDWYFDFISPFAYLQSEQLQKLAPFVRLRYRPVLFAGLLKHWGQKGPAEIDPKRQFTFEFCIWQAERLGIPFKMPPLHPFNPLALLRLATAADSRPEIVHAIFRFVWQDGRLPDTPLEWLELTSLLGLPHEAAHISKAQRQRTAQSCVTVFYNPDLITINYGIVFEDASSCGRVMTSWIQRCTL